MRGAIDYLWRLRDACAAAEGSCRDCPLGRPARLEDTRCPRLRMSREWTDADAAEMVRDAFADGKEDER